MKKQEVIDFLEKEVFDLKSWYEMRKHHDPEQAAGIKKELDIHRYLLNMIKKGEKK